MRCFFSRAHLFTLIACCLLKPGNTPVEAAPPTKPLLSSRNWATYARAMESHRTSTPRPSHVETTNPYRQASWQEVLEADSVLVNEPKVSNTLLTESCSGCASGTCNHHQQSCRTWLQLDYLLGWRKGHDVPALVTTSIDGTSITDAGRLGLPSTSIVLGNESLRDGTRPGARIDFGRWLANGETAVAARFYALSDTSTSHRYDGSSHAILARPFFNVVTDAEDALIVQYPSTDVGSVEVSTGASLLGSDIYLRQSWCQIRSACVDLITGYQFTRVDEHIHIHNTSNSPQVQSLEVTDQFDTQNTFHGGLLGLIAQTEGPCWSLSLLAKVGMGTTAQTVAVDGSTTITDVSGGVNTIGNGLLAQPSNIGTHTSNVFTVVPELNLRYTHHVTDSIDVAIGYTYIYWSQMARPGDQINLNIDPTGGTQPIHETVNSDYWMQSLDFGITWWF